MVEVRGSKNGEELMKKSIRLLIFTTLFFGKIANGLTFEDQFHERLIEVGWKQCLSELGQYSLDEQRYILGRALQSFSRNSIPRDPARQESLEMAQSAMLATSGHAKYYQEKLESMRSEALANLDKSSDEIERMRLGGKITELGDYDDFRQTIFPILGLLPSCETVSVLGHFLNDPESRDGRDLTGEVIRFTDYQHYPPNCAAAYIAIANLGIEKPPGGAKPDRNAYDYNLAEVDAWKNWWNQVKDGNRTYRFIGSPIEYGPDGPASVEVIQRAKRNMKRDEERTAGHKKSFSVGEPTSVIAQIRKPSSIIAIFIAFALIAGAAWYFLIRRRTR
jgi:hypothetical protein